jgi:hypothetical protein
MQAVPTPHSIVQVFQAICQHSSSYQNNIRTILMHTSEMRNFRAYKIREFYTHSANLKSLLKPHNDTDYKKCLTNITKRWVSSRIFMEVSWEKVPSLL